MFSEKTIKLSELSKLLKMELIRDVNFAFIGKVPTQLCNRLVPCNLPKHIEAAIDAIGIVGIITKEEYSHLVPDKLGLAISESPTATAYHIQQIIAKRENFQWKDFDSKIDATVTIHPTAFVAPKNVIIGPDSVIKAGAIINERTIIGARCSIGEGTVISCDAFEVNTDETPHRLIKQSGGVWLEDDVEILSKVTIVRATFGGFTKVGSETKMDNHVHIAHDCIIGKRVHITACAELSGRITIGDDAFLGPNCSISNGLRIGEGSVITIGATVVQDVPDGQRVSGNFAIPHIKWIKFIKSIVK